MNTTVAIVGAGDTSSKAPISSKIDVWGLNEHAVKMKKLDLWFQMHSREVFTASKKDEKHLEHLKDSKCPIMMQKHFDDIPQSVMYPLDKYQRVHTNRFGSTIDYMLAHAISLGYSKIELWGVDMMDYTEFASQRATCMYFIGYALGKGIDVWIHPDSGLIKDDLYGYRDFNNLDGVVDNIRKYDKQIMELEKSISYADGVITSLKEFVGKDFSAIEQEKKSLTDEILEIYSKKEIALARFNKLSGNNRDVEPILH